MVSAPSFALGDLPLDRPVPIPDLAKRAKVKTHVMRRWLLSARAAHPDKGVLVRVNGRWMVPSIAKLREVWPDFGKTFMGPEEAQRIDQEVRDLKREFGSVRARLRASEEARRADRALVEELAKRVGAVSQEAREMRSLLAATLSESSRLRSG